MRAGEKAGGSPRRGDPAATQLWTVVGQVVSNAPDLTVRYHTAVAGVGSPSQPAHNLEREKRGVRFEIRGDHACTVWLEAGNARSTAIVGSATGYRVVPGQRVEVGLLYWGPRSVWVRVVDPLQNPVKPLCVRVRDPATGIEREDITDTNGELMLNGLSSEHVLVSTKGTNWLRGVRSVRVPAFVSLPSSPHVVELAYRARFRIRGFIGNEPLETPVRVLYKGLGDRAGYSAYVGADDGVFALPPGRYRLTCEFGRPPKRLRADAVTVRVEEGGLKEFRVSVRLPAGHGLVNICPLGVPDDGNKTGTTVLRYAPRAPARGQTGDTYALGRRLTLVLPAGPYRVWVAWMSSAQVFLGRVPIDVNLREGFNEDVEVAVRQAGGLAVTAVVWYLFGRWRASWP